MEKEAEQLTPRDWLKTDRFKSITILDCDGWTYQEWTEQKPITLEEFTERLSQCTKAGKESESLNDDSLHTLPVPEELNIDPHSQCYTQTHLNELADGVAKIYEKRISDLRSEHQQELHEEYQRGYLNGQHVGLTDARQAILAIEGKLKGLHQS